jgi:tetratricopeptide (TPR) repeat protein
MTMGAVPRVALLATLALGVSAVPASAATKTAAPKPVVAGKSAPPKTAVEAAARLRALYFARDFEGGTADGVRLAARFPESDEVRAWYLMNRVRPWHEDEALVRDAEAMVAERPDSPWALFALAGVFNWSNVRYEEALPASKRALAAMPGHPDALWLRAMTLALRGRQRKAVRFVERRRGDIAGPAELLNAKGFAWYRLARGDGWSFDEDLMARAYSAFEEARAADPQNLNAHYLHGFCLVRMKRHAEAYPLLKKAVTLSPLSTEAHEAYWQAVMGLPDRPAEKKTAEIESDIRRLRAARGSHPETLFAISQQYDTMGDEAKTREVRRRILTIAPDSEEAEWALANDQRDLAEKMHQDGAKPGERDRKAYVKMLRDYIARPRHLHLGLLGEAYANLLYMLREDPATGADELLEIARKMIEYETYNVYNTYPAAAVVLAERGAHLEEAEAFARAAFPAIREHMEEHRGSYDGEETWNSFNDHYLARAHDALGWVLFHRGRLDEAERELMASHDLEPRSDDNLFHLGRLHEARGDLDRAEEFYAKGLRIEVLGENPSLAAFEALYEKRHGGREGLQAYLDEMRDSSREARLKRVLGARLPEPEPIVPFDLRALDGSRLSTADLEGRITVINFWGLWCGWCVEEMPDFQRLHERYRDDPQVRILTIDNDPFPERVRDWMRRRKYDFPVLLDDGYLNRTSVHIFPTTWFLDRQGRKVFEKEGYSRHLEEEFAWRIEAIRGAAGGAAGGEP